MHITPARNVGYQAAWRVGFGVAAGLAALLAVVAVVRPEMMGMAMMHRLIVGFGL